MPLQTILLSSAGTSGSAALNWRGGKPAAVVVTSTSSTAVAIFNVQYTYDDPMLTAAAAVSWVGVSSNPYAVDTAGATVFTTSTIFPDGVYIPFPISPAAVRLNSTTNASSVVVTLRVIQGEGW